MGDIVMDLNWVPTNPAAAKLQTDPQYWSTADRTMSLATFKCASTCTYAPMPMGGMMIKEMLQAAFLGTSTLQMISIGTLRLTMHG